MKIFNGGNMSDAMLEWMKIENTAYRDLMTTRLVQERERKPMLPFERGNPDTYFRSSSLGYACARAEALCIVNRADVKSLIPSDLTMIFEQGTAFHTMQQIGIVPKIALDGQLGWWRGRSGRLVNLYDEQGKAIFIPRSEAAIRLGEDPSNLEYEEIHLFDHEHGLKGHPDGVLDWSAVQFPHAGHHGGLEILEYKTRNEDSFVWGKVCMSSGGAPLDNHIFQVQAYMAMTGIDWARIIYIRKGRVSPKVMISSGHAEWLIESDKEVQNVIWGYLDDWFGAIKEAWLNDVLPKKKCKSYSDTKARECPFREACFKGKSLKRLPDGEVSQLEDEVLRILS